MAVTIINKADGSLARVEGARIPLSADSVVRVPVSPDEVAAFERQDSTLILRLRSGGVIRIEGFYSTDSELVLEDNNGNLWLGDSGDGLADFSFSEIESVDQLVGASEGSSPLLPILGIIGGGAAIIGAASGGGGNDGDAGQEGAAPGGGSSDGGSPDSDPDGEPDTDPDTGANLLLILILLLILTQIRTGIGKALQRQQLPLLPTAEPSAMALPTIRR